MSANKNLCFVHLSTSVSYYIVHLFSALKHSCYDGTLSGFCLRPLLVMYLRVTIVRFPYYSFSLVYAGKHLYNKYQQ